MEGGKGTFFSFFQILPPFLQKLLDGLQFLRIAKFLQSCLVLKGRGEPVEKDWKLKRSDTGGPTAFPANFSDNSDNSDDSDNALYKG